MPQPSRTDKEAKVKAVDLAVAVVLVALALEGNPVVALVALAADLAELAIKAARAVQRSRRRADRAARLDRPA